VLDGERVVRGNCSLRCWTLTGVGEWGGGSIGGECNGKRFGAVMGTSRVVITVGVLGVNVGDGVGEVPGGHEEHIRRLWGWGGEKD